MGSWLLSRKVVKQALRLSFQLLTWSSQQKSFNTSRKRVWKLTNLPRLKIYGWKLIRIKLSKDTKFYRHLYRRVRVWATHLINVLKIFWLCEAMSLFILNVWLLNFKLLFEISMDIWKLGLIKSWKKQTNKQKQNLPFPIQRFYLTFGKRSM